MACNPRHRHGGSRRVGCSARCWSAAAPAGCSATPGADWPRAGAAPRLGAANLFRLEWWLRHRSYADPPDDRRRVGRDHRADRAPAPPQALPQATLRAAHAPAAALHRSAARRRGDPQRAARDRLVQPHGGAAAEPAPHGRPRACASRTCCASRSSCATSPAATIRTPSSSAPPTGEDSYLSLQVAPYGDGQLLLLVRDVSRQMRLEAVRRDFVANASHELRSPLTVISGYLETLAPGSGARCGSAGAARGDAPPGRAHDRDHPRPARAVAAGGDRRDRRRRAGRRRSADRACCARTCWRAPGAPARRAACSVESDARLIGDEPEIHSAFSNLVDNAAKYTPPDGSIEIRWWVDEDGGHFAVTDTGIGIPPEHIPRLTERFYRVDAGRSRATGGSGLGLAIVKHVLQRHGGTLEVQERARGRQHLHLPSSRRHASSPGRPRGAAATA